MHKKFFENFLKDLLEVEFYTKLPKNRKRFNEIVIKVNDGNGQVFATENTGSYKISCNVKNFFKIKKEINKMLKEEKNSA